MNTLDTDHLRQWIGRTETLADQASLAPLQALSATLDREDPPPRPGDDVPPCWHWLFFLPLHRASAIGPDGHPKRGGFMPPVPLPRRMWAGSRLTFERPLLAGQALKRESRIEDVSVKEGRSGRLAFVKVRHAVSDARGLAIVEEQDIVYRAMPRPGETAPSPKAAPTDEHFKRTIVPDPVLLFRFSALTFNGHRIHYDRPYATGEEGYAGLVVHGPLIATLLLDLLRRSRPELRVTAFEFKAVSPLIDTAHFEVCGRVEEGTVALWARGPDGGLAMQATARVEAA